MSNALLKEARENIRYTEFENNQVLTADQLNDLFRYLDIQSRLTRTRGIGVGIICGLEIGVTDQNKIMVSSGNAITTDGDLLHFTSDQTFDQFVKFEDSNSKYNYFHNDSNVQIPLFQLIKSEGSRSAGKNIDQFATEAGAPLKDFIGILYQEDYNSDTDLCTGEDCDNRGIECVKDLKVLLAHKDQLAEILQSIPTQNKNYFALDDIEMPRAMLKKSVKKHDDLKGIFISALNVKESLIKSLEKAYEVCKPIVEDDLGSNDPVAVWKELLKKQFDNINPVYIEYLYDYSRDLCYAYNELRESLFNDNSICCPPVELFPKHIMMGLIKTASVKRPILQPAVAGTVIPTHLLLSLRRTIRFDIGEIIRRFHPVNIDTEYRHSFYESPVLNNKDEMTERTIFCFKRIDAMIRNFKVPESTDLQNVNSIRILPSHFEDRNLGERTIPFYYNFIPSLPVNAYWNFEDNIRRKENSIKYFFSAKYGLTKDPLQQNLLPYSFYRIEGHLGFKYQEVERVLNNIIDENNLPINLITVQIEDDVEKVPVRDWYFPELHLYEHFVRQAFVDHLEQVEMVHNGINESLDEKIRTTIVADDVTLFKKRKSNIEDSVVTFNSAKKAVLEYKPVTQSTAATVEKFKTDVGRVISATTEIKRHTKDFAFSNTAIPHDFVINTDILRKADLFADLTDQKIKKKKEALILSNFLKLNPGLEHAGGVLRGGTFVLVYTSQDDRVVADFMLPYANVDKDIVPNPPKPTPLPPTVKIPPKLNPKIIEIEPPYMKALDKRMTLVNTKIDLFDNRIGGFDLKLNGFGNKFEGLDTKLTGVDFKIAGIRTLPTGTITPGSPVAGIDFDAKFSDLISKLDKHEGKFTTIGTEIDSVKTKLVTHEGKFGEFNNQLSGNITKLGEVTTKVSGVEATIISNNTKLNEVKDSINGIEGRLGTTDSKFADLNGRVTAVDSKINNNDSKVNNVNNLIAALDGKVNNHVTTLGSLNTRIADIQVKVNDQDVKLNRVDTRITDFGRVSPVSPGRPGGPIR